MIALQQKLVELAQSIVDTSEDLEISLIIEKIQELHKWAVVYEFISQQKDDSQNWQKHLQELSETLNLSNTAIPESEEPHEVAPLIETIKNMIPEMPEDPPSIPGLLEDVPSPPVFVKKESQQEPTQETPPTLSDTSPKPNLNDKYHNKTGFGLNDRLAFINHLFQGNATDFNRVVSQISTLDDWTAVESYLNDYIQPEYPHWTEKPELVERFIDHLKKNFTS